MRSRARIIGVTGGSGAGKGEVCRILAHRGALIIDTDTIAHRVILMDSPAYDEVLAAFGRKILGDDGQIARKKLGAIVFADKAKLAVLSGIVHKYVRVETERIITEGNCGLVVIDAAALIEAGMEDICDVVIGVFAEKNLRLQRIMARDDISCEDARRRIESQMADDVLRGYVDVTVENNGSLAELDEKVRRAAGI